MRLFKKVFPTKGWSITQEQSLGFFTAVAEGNLEEIRTLLEGNRALVSAYRRGYGYTPLQIAAERGDKSILKLLLAKGAKVNGEGFRGDTPSGETPLYLATLGRHREAVKLLLTKGAKVNGWLAGADKTPLHNAAETGDISIVELLLVHKADVNARPKYLTPLDSAVRAGHKDVVDLLRRRGGHAHSTEEILEGCEPLKKPRRVREAPENIVSILKAACEGDAIEVRNLLNEHPGLLFSSAGIYCVTPLRTAAHYGHAKVVELLLAKGAEINADGNKGQTPLHEAVGNGHRGVGELLLAKGAEVNAQSDRGRTPLHEAASAGHGSVVELLLAKGARINVKDDRGRTPLHEAAAEKSQIGVVKLLLANKADVTVMDDQGATPLHLAEAGYSVQMGLENDPIWSQHVVNNDVVELLRQRA